LSASLSPVSDGPAFRQPVLEAGSRKAIWHIEGLHRLLHELCALCFRDSQISTLARTSVLFQSRQRSLLSLLSLLMLLRSNFCTRHCFGLMISFLSFQVSRAGVLSDLSAEESCPLRILRRRRSCGFPHRY
jgi:hypothetical protein